MHCAAALGREGEVSGAMHAGASGPPGMRAERPLVPPTSRRRGRVRVRARARARVDLEEADEEDDLQLGGDGQRVPLLLRRRRGDRVERRPRELEPVRLHDVADERGHRDAPVPARRKRTGGGGHRLVRDGGGRRGRRRGRRARSAHTHLISAWRRNPTVASSPLPQKLSFARLRGSQ